MLLTSQLCAPSLALKLDEIWPLDKIINLQMVIIIVTTERERGGRRRQVQLRDDNNKLKNNDGAPILSCSSFSLFLSSLSLARSLASAVGATVVVSLLEALPLSADTFRWRAKLGRCRRRCPLQQALSDHHTHTHTHTHKQARLQHIKLHAAGRQTSSAQ